MNAPRLAPLIFLAAVGCGAETGNGLDNGLKMQLVGGTSAALSPRDAARYTARDAQGSPLTIQASRVNVRHVEFELPGGRPCAGWDFGTSGLEIKCDSAKFRIEGPIVFDLITGAPTPSFAGLRIPPNTYKRVDVRIDDVTSDDTHVPAGDPLRGASLVATGSITIAGDDDDDPPVTTPFDLSLRFDEDARFESAGGITVSESGGEDVLLSLDVTQWFANLPITECVKDDDLELVNGRLQIRDRGGKCSAIERELKDSIKRGTRLDEEDEED
jgi:hypothetical protein